MKTLRCVVVDDEPLARELLVSMLQDLPGIDLAGEFGDAAEALEAIRSAPPDVLFLDIRMPEIDGLQFAMTLDEEGIRPAVVFVTAFDQHAVEAFELEAVDYLLKPFDEERLERTIERVRKREAGAAPPRSLTDLAALLESARRGRVPERLVVREEERAFFVRIDSIDWIEATGKLVNIHHGRKVHAIRTTLSKLASDLAPAGFIRVSRSAVVNANRIQEIQPWFQGEYALIMSNGERVTTTRGYRRAVSELLGRG